MTHESHDMLRRPHFLQITLLLALCTGSFLTLLDANILNIALPAIQKDFAATIRDLQWAVDGYVLSSASLLIGMGVLIDKWGARRMYLWGLAGFALFSLLCMIAQSAFELTIYRILLGIAGAILLPSSLALINHTYNDKHTHTKAMGVWAALSGFAMAAGPLLGGFLTQFIGWRAVFAVAVPFAAIGFMLVWRKIDETPTHNRSIHLVPQVLLLFTGGGAAFCFIQSGTSGLISLPCIVAGLLSLLSGLMLWRHERRSSDRLVPRTVLQHPAIVQASLLGALVNFGLMGFTFYVAIFLQVVRGLSVIETSFAFLALTIPLAVNPPRSARLVNKIGPYKPLVGGFLALTLAVAALLLPIVQQLTPLYLMCLLVMGFGVTYIIPPLTILTMRSAPAGLTGVVSALLNTSRQYGTLAGIAVIGLAMGTVTAEMNVPLPLVVILLSFAVGLAGAIHLNKTSSV